MKLLDIGVRAAKNMFSPANYLAKIYRVFSSSIAALVVLLTYIKAMPLYIQRPVIKP